MGGRSEGEGRFLSLTLAHIPKSSQCGPQTSSTNIPGELLRQENFPPHRDLQNQNVHLNQIPRGSACTLKLGHNRSQASLYLQHREKGCIQAAGVVTAYRFQRLGWRHHGESQ